jgi:hypothetical protein
MGLIKDPIQRRMGVKTKRTEAVVRPELKPFLKAVAEMIADKMMRERESEERYNFAGQTLCTRNRTWQSRRGIPGRTGRGRMSQSCGAGEGEYADAGNRAQARAHAGSGLQQGVGETDPAQADESVAVWDAEAIVPCSLSYAYRRTSAT